jgi:hypothetical protein
LTDVAVVRQTVGRIGINHHCIDANADASRFSTTIAPKFCIGDHRAIANLCVPKTQIRTFCGYHGDISERRTGWLTLEDSNYRITFFESAFDISSLFPLFWGKRGLGDLIPTKLQNVERTAGSGAGITGVNAHR